MACLDDVPPLLTQAATAGPFQLVSPEAVLFHFPKVARYRIEAGQNHN
ncbi:MAG: hypothetical protein R3D55_07300 [Chloroflexota bacterium]